MKPGFCWCDMCGYTAKVKPKDRLVFESQVWCKDCDEEGMASLLEDGDELPEHVVPHDPMPTYKPWKPSI